jgi:hypothetical protein
MISGARCCAQRTKQFVTVLGCVAGSLAIFPSASGASGVPITKGDLVVSLESGSVDEYTPAGKFVQHVITAADGLGLPAGSAFDGQGNLFVTDFANDQILKRDALTGVVSVFSNNTMLGGGHVFDAPESIVFDKDYAHMLVSDANRNGPGGGINVLNALTGASTAFYPLPSSSGSEGAGESDWLAFDAHSTLYMTNENPTQGIMKVDPSTGDIVQPSLIPNLPNVAYALSFDKNGNVWLGDTNRILEFTPTGAPINVITNPSFSTVFAAVFNPGGDQFYAGDLGTGAVYTYALDGTLKGSFNAGGGVSGLAVSGAAVPPNTASDRLLQSAANEPSISVDPTDAGRLLVGYQGISSPGHFTCGWTTMVGSSSSHGWLSEPSSSYTTGLGDATTAMDQAGNAYLACLTRADSNDNAAQHVSAVVVGRSTDHGATFSTPSIVTTSYCAHNSPSGDCNQGSIVDQEAMAAGAAGQVYVCWTEFSGIPGLQTTKNSIYMAHSTNSTATRWSRALLVSGAGNSGALGCTVTVTGTGRVWVGWWDSDVNEAFAAYSDNGGASISHRILVGQKATFGSTDSGVLGHHVWLRANPQPGSNDVAALWATADSSDHAQTLISYTSGTAWPGSGTPLDPDPGVSTRQPTLAWGADGKIAVGFYDQVGDSVTYWTGQATPGGSFTYKQVASAPSNVAQVPTVSPMAARLGDYTAVGESGGSVYAAWSDDRNDTVQSVWFGD